MANYSRNCKDCGRRINLRLMPHGRWVAFEGDEPHNCDERPVERVTPSVRPNSLRPAEPPVEPFTPLYPEVPKSPTPGQASPQPTPSPQGANSPTASGPAPASRPTPARPTPAPRPAPRGPSLPTPIGSPPTPRPATAPQPAPPRKPSRLGAIFALITGLLGSTVGLLFAVFGLMSLPLGVVATMHLTGWSWFGAIIGVLLFSCIPLVGQIGYLILAVMGAYYLWTANFDWQQAAYPSAQTFSVATLSESELGTASSVTQCRSNPVSGRSLPKTGVFRMSAGDYRLFRPGNA
jgi:hypothetical protein